jgi:hypothetical protein
MAGSPRCRCRFAIEAIQALQLPCYANFCGRSGMCAPKRSSDRDNVFLLLVIASLLESTTVSSTVSDLQCLDCEDCGTSLVARYDATGHLTLGANAGRVRRPIRALTVQCRVADISKSPGRDGLSNPPCSQQLGRLRQFPHRIQDSFRHERKSKFKSRKQQRQYELRSRQPHQRSFVFACCPAFCGTGIQPRSLGVEPERFCFSGHTVRSAEQHQEY